MDEEFDGCDINVLSHPSSFYVVMEQPKINGLNERNDNLPDLRKRSTCILYSILTIILNSIFTDSIFCRQNQNDQK